MSVASYIAGFTKVAQSHGVDNLSLLKYAMSSGIVKKSNWSTDGIVNWLTDAFRKQSDEYRKSIGLKPLGDLQYETIKKYHDSHRNGDQLIDSAKRVSEGYKPSSLGRSKFVTGGKVVAS